MKVQQAIGFSPHLVIERDEMEGHTRSSSVPIDGVETLTYTVPTDAPESDGTLEWDSTTLVLVRASGGGEKGLGYTDADTATSRLIQNLLAKVVKGRDALEVPQCWQAMVSRTRNLGRPGIVSMAISAVDSALWDLKARLLLPLVRVLGRVRESVPVYGSGGFTSYCTKKLQNQLAGWVEQGVPRVMKIGRDVAADAERVRAVRKAIGSETELFVDANGAYSRKQALEQAQKFCEVHVKWFEEPVSSDDLPGLRLLRDRAPACMEIAAGEYGYEAGYFRRMMAAGAVDVVQADATRCGGITGFLEVAALCAAYHLPLSAHTAPALHRHVGCAAIPLRHLEYFHDHVRCNVAVVMDWSKYLDNIIELNPREKFARVEPGTICDTVRKAAKPHTLTWGPDPATHDHCTFGGMLGNNSCGVHAQMAGKAGENVLSMDILLYDGTQMTVGSMNDAELEQQIAQGGRVENIYARLKSLRNRYAKLMEQRYPRIPRRVSGYNLDRLLPGEDGRFNIAATLVGSESTCLTILEAKVRLIYSYPKRVLLVLGYPSIYEAGDHVPELLKYQPIGFEGLDEFLIGNVKKKKMPQVDDLSVLPEGKGWLIVEFGGATTNEAEGQRGKP